MAGEKPGIANLLAFYLRTWPENREAGGVVAEFLTGEKREIRQGLTAGSKEAKGMVREAMGKEIIAILVGGETEVKDGSKRLAGGKQEELERGRFWFT